MFTFANNPPAASLPGHAEYLARAQIFDGNPPRIHCNSARSGTRRLRSHHRVPGPTGLTNLRRNPDKPSTDAFYICQNPPGPHVTAQNPVVLHTETAARLVTRMGMVLIVNEINQIHQAFVDQFTSTFKSKITIFCIP